MASLAQIKLIQSVRNKLHIPEEEYRAVINSLGVASTKDLTNEQVNSVLELFKKFGYKQTIREGYATPKQISLIRRVWNSCNKVRQKTDESLEKFVFRIAGVQKMSWLPRPDVQKVIKAIRSL